MIGQSLRICAGPSSSVDRRAPVTAQSAARSPISRECSNIEAAGEVEPMFWPESFSISRYSLIVTPGAARYSIAIES